MATIKSFTDLQQSKKLAEILPLESADMRIGNYVGKSGKVDGTNVHYYPKGESFGAPEIINAWSLSALLDILPTLDDRNANFCKDIRYDKWHVYYHSTATSSIIDTERYDNLIDACYEMIIRLNELKKL